ncbi:hypothetical protein HJFPF1_01238 [Paramyrothecium foliicola]|nr:hypothetical protein HJFPF1_01238 [Paramyrothecium foliicola]
MRELALLPAMRKVAAIIALANSVTAHSWIESASKVARNGTLVGEVGFARGYVPRTSTNPPYSDTIPTYLLPANGQSAYSGDEIINKFKFEANPQFPMLEAAAGDHIALRYLENGHTTLPDNQPNKPRNRGTVFLYGTTRPKDEEKLFDVHLIWNRDGTGGDGRGILLATRNYDDGQCFQPNGGSLSTSRAAEFADEGAKHEQELACQTDLKLPDNLEPGSIYTIYWYWDWPDLNPERINIEATKNGIFPWAGTFMRGETDPNGFTADAIARNESYASVIDIKITDQPQTLAAKEEVDFSAVAYIDDQSIYSKAIEEQMRNNYLVDVDGGAGNAPPAPPTNAPSAPTNLPPPAVTTPGAGATVTVTQTVAPTTLVTTVYKTVPAAPVITSSPTQPPAVSTVMVTITSHVPAAPSPDNGLGEPPVPTSASSQDGRPVVSPFMRLKRANWGFGQ